MIDIVCVFLLFCFAIMSSIKTIESAGNQITPSLFVNETYDENYVRTVNKLKTFNKHSIVIKSADVKMLSSLAYGSKKYQLKLQSRIKLEIKGHDIKCSFCVIAKSEIFYLKNLVQKLKREPIRQMDVENLKRLEEEVKIILRILLLGDLKTGKWLWAYFLKIDAIRQHGGSIPFTLENLFEDDQLQIGVSDSIRNCMAKNYLPSSAMESDFVLKNMYIYNMFCVLQESGCVSNVLNDGVLVATEFLYLLPFWDDENQLLFRQITEVNVDWSEPKQRHEAEVVITREFVENSTWMYKPYGRLDHQHLLIKIIDARFYCYISVILYVYEKQLSILDEQTLKHIKDLIYNAIHGVLEITAFKDEFLVIIVSELKFSKINDTDDIKNILARVRTKANEILNDLNCASTSGVDRFSFIVNEHQLLTNNLIIRIITNFLDYLNKLKGICWPFEYKVLLHFMDEVKVTAARHI